MPQEKYLTVSVDDGHPADCRSAQLLHAYDLRATFYIPQSNPERAVMSESDIKSIAESFEIGGHTYSHRPLTGLRNHEMRKEIRDGKDWAQQLLGRETVAFCYPRGKFNRAVINAVRDAGFKGARTCRYHLNDIPGDPFLWGVSTHAYSHTKAVLIRHAILEHNWKGLINFLRIQKGVVDWVNQFKCAVEYVEKHGGIAHLYFHSWEIDALHAWGRLEDLFCYLSEKKDLRRVTNGELFALCHDQESAV